MITHRLSVLTDYYVRKLIRRYQGRLKSVVAEGASLEADTQTSVDRVLESLYLEPDEIAVQVRELEVMVRYHQQLDQKLPRTNPDLQAVEHKILWVIGFKVLEAMNRASSQDKSPAYLASGLALAA
jgi:sulfur carrier protein ThiS